MEVFLYAIIFIIGTFFGSFFTLAVYRIPKREDILIKHSYCPNCNHKLGFFDLFPVLSYVFLRGQCRYCKEKIRPRYLILELLSGFTFLAIAFSTKFKIVSGASMMNLVFTLLYVSLLFIIAGIDKEKKYIAKGVILFGFMIEIIYIIYQCTLGNCNVYQYVIYSLFLIFLLIISNISLKVLGREEYYIQILFLSLYMIIFCGSVTYIITVILTLMMISIHQILSKRKNTEFSIGFYLCISNILVIIMSNIMINYLI